MVGIILLTGVGIWLVFSGGAFLVLAYEKGMRKSWAFLRLAMGVGFIAVAVRLAWGHGSF